MPPLISICLPVLNARPFLEARLDSIFSQTFQNWELIVVDGCSDDGSWEYILERCAGEPQARLQQAPREGIYAAINLATSQALGRWIYIATADDTMAPRCLETLLSLATAQKTPCIAQCGLTLIDENGVCLPEGGQWPRNSEWHEVLGGLFEKAHLRPAPFDGAMVMLFGTGITSLTQALFPKEAFLRLGGFPAHVGSAGDMAWEGLLGFFYDVTYSPERLATWRYHSAQATRNPQAADASWPDRRVRIGQWILQQLRVHSEALHRRAVACRLGDYNPFWRSRIEMAEVRAPWSRISAIKRMMTDCPWFFLKYLGAKFLPAKPCINTDPVTSVRMQMVVQFLGQSLVSLQQAVQGTEKPSLGLEMRLANEGT